MTRSSFQTPKRVIFTTQTRKYSLPISLGEDDTYNSLLKNNTSAQGGQYLDRVPESESRDGIAPTEAVVDGEAVEAGMAPEESGRRIAEDPTHLPGRPEGSLPHLPLRCHGAPQPANARRPSEILRRQELEDRPEEVPGDEGGEVGVHG